MKKIIKPRLIIQAGLNMVYLRCRSHSTTAFPTPVVISVSIRAIKAKCDFVGRFILVFTTFSMKSAITDFINGVFTVVAFPFHNRFSVSEMVSVNKRHAVFSDFWFNGRTIWANKYHSIVTSFVNVPCEAQGQSKPLHLLSHAFYFGLSTQGKRIKSWLYEAEKTCQAHFFRVEAKLKKECGYFAHQFVILEGLT